MPFPVTTGNVTWQLSDFSGLNYVTGLPQSVSSIHTQFTKLSTGTSTTSLSITSGVTISFTTQTGLNIPVGSVINLSEAALPTTRYMQAMVDSYDPLTGDVQAYTSNVAGSGTYSSWIISPAVELDYRFIDPASYPSFALNPIPLTVSYGGTGSVDSVSSDVVQAETGLAFPKFCMERIFTDFTERMSYLAPDYPWYILRTVSGVGGVNALATMQALHPSDTVANVSSGVLLLSSTGNSVAERINYGRIFVGYGKVGFMHPTKGGPIEWRTRYRPSHDLSSATVTRTRMGLRGSGSSFNVDFFDAYGLGFEACSDSENGALTCVIASAGVRTRQSTQIPVLASGWLNLAVIVDPYHEIAEWYVNGNKVWEASVAAFVSSASMLHPAFAHETVSTATRSAAFDYLYCTHRVARA